MPADTSSNSSARPVAAPRRGSLLIIFLTVFIDLLGFSIVLPLLPLYARQFAEDAHGWKLGLLMASFPAMQFLFAPWWGRLSDRVGRRPVLLVGLGASAVCYFLFGLATVWQSLTWLFVARVGAGVAGATIPTAQAYIADTTTLQNRAKGMALIGMAFGLGFTCGPVLGYLAAPTGQGAPGPWPGYVAACLSAAAFLCALFVLPESLHAGSESAGRRLFDPRGLREALLRPSIGLLMLAVFVCLYSFTNFETTLSLLIHPEKVGSSKPTLTTPFHFTYGQVCLTYAYIGLTLALVQGGVVRRLSGRVSEGALAVTGAVLELAGFAGTAWAIQAESTPLLLAAVAVVTAGFSFLQPTLQGLISRRSDPKKQGLVLGVAQSVNALARIIGAYVGIPLLYYHLACPYLLAMALMAAGALLLAAALRQGGDYQPEGAAARQESR